MDNANGRPVFAKRLVVTMASAAALAALALGSWLSAPRSASAQAPDLSAIGSVTDAKTGITWVRIPGGRFDMGSATGAKDEKPVHKVTIKSFEMAKTEVTVDQYRRCVNAGKCTEPDRYDVKNPWRKYCNWRQGGRDEHPVNCVDWYQARAYALWAGGRLPTEAEWEYATRSGDRGWEYPWGSDAPSCQKAVMENGGAGCGKVSTWPVCSKLAGRSAHGLCDLSGNVWEWVQDLWHDSYKRAPKDGRAWESADGANRVIRGGSWNHPAAKLRASFRAWFGPGYRDLDLGFRVARNAP
ncbi:MAG: formylglycine-generating enzyme family protein [Polyangia bacterium]|jgi:formylglycine-generating enzyme required for sulfatase activity|nr:formylglycine-generating enzyme family protein [Polyangia bacterium]